MRRSNRLVVLVGLFLAVVAFVGVFVILSKTPDTTSRNEVNQVVAAADIPLGTTITQSMVTTKTVPSDQAVVGAYTDPSLVIGQTARKAMVTGQLVTSDAFVASAANIQVPPGSRGISVQVDQVTGVGTLIQPGDFVDLVITVPTADWGAPVAPAASAGAQSGGTAGGNLSSTKLLLQGMQVLGTLLPTPTATPTPGASGAPNQPVLNGQQEIVIVSVPAQYAEAINFAQAAGDKITLILRSSKDCVIPGQSASPAPSAAASGAPSAAPSAVPGSACSTAQTTGIDLKTLVDRYGVLTPEVVNALLASPRP